MTDHRPPVLASAVMRHFGISYNTLQSWTKLGVPYLGGDGTWRRYFLHEVEAWLRQHDQLRERRGSVTTT